MKHRILSSLIAATLMSVGAHAEKQGSLTHVADHTISSQRSSLEKNTEGQGYGPQSPRDIDSLSGTNDLSFSHAPHRSKMNLCNIHFHESAEHKGGEFTKFVGNGDGSGFNSGYKYSGKLNKQELEPLGNEVCMGKHGGLTSGDTIEVHYVYTSARVTPGETLGACLSSANKNPQLRVEAQVYVLVNDKHAEDFIKLADHKIINGHHQALNIPSSTGTPVEYSGSTTGPSYNESGSPFHVTWNVRPKVVKVDIGTVGQWCKSNAFNEDHAHSVRNLVVNPSLLSAIK